MKKPIKWWLIVFVLLALSILVFVPDPAEKANTLKGLAIAAIISLFYVLKSLNSSWTGTITEIKTKHFQTDDDNSSETYDVDYATIKLSNGKTKKIKSQKGWKLGDKLEKNRGESEILVVK